MQCSPPGRTNSLCISNFLNDQPCSKQSQTGQGKKNATFDSHMPFSSLLSYTIKFNMSLVKPQLLPQHHHLLILTKIVTFASEKQNVKISGVHSFRVSVK